ncbi:DUF3298 and DUF4163 domain-containing protein [Marilutibacter alkalisoli]|nr:DUF3298 and DUF4163 domain-containing protein [Lysobacter alkalisoli]
MHNSPRLLIVLSLMLAAVVACDRGKAPETPAAAGAPGAVSPEPGEAPLDEGPVELNDVSEVTADYVIGISFPPSAMKYPGLAAELKRYADDARADLMQAVAARSPEETGSMYDLSLTFTQVTDTPLVFAIAADGSSYTGGAHGSPLLARFVWLPGENRRLRAADLIAEGEGWDAVSSMVRERLHTALSQRLDADDLEPAERSRMMRDAGRMIDDGTGPEAENYSEFEPVTGADGRVTAIRFVFPPYQVGPYSDGEQVVELPTELLLPHIVPEYRKLFADL